MKKYEMPKLVLTIFAAEEIITTSIVIDNNGIEDGGDATT